MKTLLAWLFMSSLVLVMLAACGQTPPPTTPPTATALPTSIPTPTPDPDIDILSAVEDWTRSGVRDRSNEIAFLLVGNLFYASDIISQVVRSAIQNQLAWGVSNLSRDNQSRVAATIDFELPLSFVREQGTRNMTLLFSYDITVEDGTVIDSILDLRSVSARETKSTQIIPSIGPETLEWIICARETLGFDVWNGLVTNDPKVVGNPQELGRTIWPVAIECGLDQATVDEVTKLYDG